MTCYLDDCVLLNMRGANHPKFQAYPGCGWSNKLFHLMLLDQCCMIYISHWHGWGSTPKNYTYWSTSSNPTNQPQLELLTGTTASFTPLQLKYRIYGLFLFLSLNFRQDVVESSGNPAPIGLRIPDARLATADPKCGVPYAMLSVIL